MSFYCLSCSLRRRFRQNQEDCTFVLLAQLPTLARHLFSELDVEALTAELQRRAEVAKRDKQSTTTAIEDSTASLDGSNHPINADIGQENGNAHMDDSFHSTLEAAQIPLPQEISPSEQEDVAQVSHVSQLHCSTIDLLTDELFNNSTLRLLIRAQRQSCGKLSNCRVSYIRLHAWPMA